jgi:hypothetical protein
MRLDIKRGQQLSNADRQRQPAHTWLSTLLHGALQLRSFSPVRLEKRESLENGCNRRGFMFSRSLWSFLLTLLIMISIQVLGRQFLERRTAKDGRTGAEITFDRKIHCTFHLLVSLL